jgi:carboxyl-terminal processing protease
VIIAASVEKMRSELADCKAMARLASLVAAFGGLIVTIAPAKVVPPSRADIFQEVWEVVRDNFLDPDFNGADWDAARKRFAPEAAKARTDEEFSSVINAMLAELRTSHTRFYTARDPEYFQLGGLFWSILAPKLKPFIKDATPRYPGIGISTYTTEGRLFIRHVFDGAPAALAGLRPGDEILDADDVPFQPIGSFTGKVGKAVKLRIRRSADAEPVSVPVTPTLLDGTTMFLEAMKASVEVVECDGVKVGYVHIWSYAGESYQAQLDAELNGRLRDADALALDLRDGWGGASPRYLWPFIAPPLTLKITERGAQPITHQEAWTKPVCLLVNEGTRSGKKLLTYYFKKTRRGSVVGSRTAGALVFGRPIVVSDGSLLFLAVSDLTVDGERLEGIGISPDVEVPFQPRFTGGSDPQKKRAIETAAKAVRK